MNHRLSRFWLLLFMGIFLFPQICLAVPPPDFLFNLGAQVFQVFSIVLLFLTAFFAGVWRFIRVYIRKIETKYKTIAGIVIFVLLASAASAYTYSYWQQDTAYQQWLAESNQSTTAEISTDEQAVEENGNSDLNDKPQEPKVETVLDPPEITFVKNYYNLIATGQLDQSYEMSKKSVSLAVYKSWYQNVAAVEVAAVKKVTEEVYLTDLSITEGEDITDYQVTLTLAKNPNGSGFQIINSTSKVVGQRSLAFDPNKPIFVVDGLNKAEVPVLNVEDQTQSQQEQQPVVDADLPLRISNENFKALTAQGSEIFVLDAREDEEFEIGNFPGSTHIRYADLLTDGWQQLPKDRPVYVFCWSGIRGSEVAKFLRKKGINAAYLADGANGWVESGGRWNGEIKFSKRYPDDRYRKLFNYTELRDAKNQGAVIVDVRDNKKFNEWRIPGSINVSVFYTPSSKIEAELSKIPIGSQVITVCDDLVSCFDAKITGIKLEKAGNDLLGRYNKPWEYRSFNP